MILFSDNLTDLLCCMDDQKLSNFCRILALTISDLDIYENKSSCKLTCCHDHFIIFFSDIRSLGCVLAVMTRNVVILRSTGHAFWRSGR